MRHLRNALAAAALAWGAMAASGSPAAAPPKVALVMPGRANEPGYYNAGFKALIAAREQFGAEIKFVESLKATDAEQVFRVLGDEGFDYVIVMGGGNYDDQIRDVADDYPHLKFIVVSGTFTRLPNIVSVRTGNAGVPYLAGVLMAGMSKTGKIGLIGARATPAAMADHVAVIAGARELRPTIGIQDIYTESYDNPALGKEAALALIDQGVDLIFTNAGTTSFGVFQAAHERQVLAVGAATDQNECCPDAVLTSATYGTDAAVVGLIALDRGPGWQNRVYTVDLAAVDLAPFHTLGPRVPSDLRLHLADVRRRLSDGRLTVPGSYDAIAIRSPLAGK